MTEPDTRRLRSATGTSASPHQAWTVVLAFPPLFSYV